MLELVGGARGLEQGRGKGDLAQKLVRAGTAAGRGLDRISELALDSSMTASIKTLTRETSDVDEVQAGCPGPSSRAASARLTSDGTIAKTRHLLPMPVC